MKFEKGHIPWNKGKKGIHISPSTEIKKGQHLSSKTEFKKGNNTGKNNLNWKGGKPYCKICGIKLSSYKSKYCQKHKGIAISISLKGTHCSKNTEFKKGRANPNKGIKRPEFSGEKCPTWTGGRWKMKIGYIMKYSPNHPHTIKGCYVYEHRLIMESIIGRFLDPKEVVHHIDGNRSNNSPENLMLFPNNTEHMKYHRQLKSPKPSSGCRPESLV